MTQQHILWLKFHVLKSFKLFDLIFLTKSFKLYSFLTNWNFPLMTISRLQMFDVFQNDIHVKLCCTNVLCGAACIAACIAASIAACFSVLLSRNHELRDLKAVLCWKCWQGCNVSEVKIQRKENFVSFKKLIIESMLESNLDKHFKIVSIECFDNFEAFDNFKSFSVAWNVQLSMIHWTEATGDGKITQDIWKIHLKT